MCAPFFPLLLLFAFLLHSRFPARPALYCSHRWAKEATLFIVAFTGDTKRPGEKERERKKNLTPDKHVSHKPVGPVFVSLFENGRLITGGKKGRVSLHTPLRSAPSV